MIVFFSLSLPCQSPPPPTNTHVYIFVVVHFLPVSRYFEPCVHATLNAAVVLNSLAEIVMFSSIWLLSDPLNLSAIPSFFGLFRINTARLLTSRHTSHHVLPVWRPPEDCRAVVATLTSEETEQKREKFSTDVVVCASGNSPTFFSIHPPKLAEISVAIALTLFLTFCSGRIAIL